MPERTSYVCTLTAAQAEQLRSRLADRGWHFAELPYAFWKAGLAGTTVVAYQSGKLTVQGKGMAELVQFLIEPEVLREARFGYEHLLAENEHPEMFTPHAGIDESGKGDYFGPLVVAACYVDADTARQLLLLKVADSKTIKSDRRIAELAAKVRTVTGGRFSLVAVGPEAYNRLYGQFGNLNRLLAWGHARALENLLEREPSCPRAISDQFGRKETVLRALKERGRSIVLEQRPKAEADIAVAAASILARAEFVRRLEGLGRQIGLVLPKGGGPAVSQAATELVRREPALLGKVAKLHFRITAAVGGPGVGGGAGPPGPEDDTPE
jgi:ribonuclease HIII